MQGVAWAQMFLRYSSDQGVRCGMEFTFDSDHPCPLCRKIEEASHRSREAKSLPTKPIATSLKRAAPFSLLCIPAIPEVPIAMVVNALDPPSAASEDRAAPPKPPPRAMPHLPVSHSLSTAALFL